MPFIEDDSDFDVGDFFGPIRQGLSVGDELYALGYDIGPIILYYNKASLQEGWRSPPPAETPMSWGGVQGEGRAVNQP